MAIQYNELTGIRGWRLDHLKVLRNQDDTVQVVCSGYQNKLRILVLLWHRPEDAWSTRHDNVVSYLIVNLGQHTVEVKNKIKTQILSLI